jgi:hypothetical protein
MKILSTLTGSRRLVQARAGSRRPNPVTNIQRGIVENEIPFGDSKSGRDRENYDRLAHLRRSLRALLCVNQATLTLVRLEMRHSVRRSSSHAGEISGDSRSVSDNAIHFFDGKWRTGRSTSKLNAEISTISNSHHQQY